MSDSIRQQCRFITQKHSRTFLRKRNVVGMGFGYKIINNINTGELCFKIFVAKKESVSNLNSNDLIPPIFNGVKTDVIQTGVFTHSSLNEKKLPLQFGYSVGPNGVKLTGTAGCLVVDRYKNYYILSNNHVLSNSDKVPIGTAILHPGVYDGGKYPDDLIGYLSKTVPLIDYNGEEEEEKFYNYVDCALAKIINPCLVTKQIAFIGGVKGVLDPEIDMRVKKTGRTTELTTGIIKELDCLFEMTGLGGHINLFADQIMTTYMSNKGDSGSLLLDEDNNAVGLLHGDGDSYSIVSPIKKVLKALEVTIVTS